MAQHPNYIASIDFLQFDPVASSTVSRNHHARVHRREGEERRTSCIEIVSHSWCSSRSSVGRCRCTRNAVGLQFHPKASCRPLINKPPSLNRDYKRDPNIQALKKRGFIHHGSTLYPKPCACCCYTHLAFQGLSPVMGCC